MTKRYPKKRFKKGGKYKQKNLATKVNNLHKLIKNSIQRPEYKQVQDPLKTLVGTMVGTLAPPQRWAGNHGYAQEITPVIGRGDQKVQRIGNRVQLRRILVQGVLESSTSGIAGTYTNVNKYKCHLYVLRVNQDDNLRAVTDILNAFDAPYKVRTAGQDAEGQMFKQQNLKVLAKRSYDLRQRTTYYGNPPGSSVQTFTQDVIINIPLNDDLIFNKEPHEAVVPVNTPLNYSYFLVLKHGNVTQALIPPNPSNSPTFLTKTQFYYTDS